ncbi:hypothetical protein Mp_1g17200 [Marchantia polymorpha subsp. ruderalis]|uniref:Uncharacterized protein n=2 Tax=Marchantia polymorpha TaxID=3197 RepID=A0AAF6AR47_MARPO|nr:hypothetical protein MARPO_0001s0060 [Marchantia polymorpha]BBM98917.1 hypothetical protein Mp_1g17200 [Marchantia polymorpha subsp. ruderalis]|eukprot:PTQ49993.1 hypothetical protein MARPO_0001s0060 [Marchantia polymorpha]
MHAYCMLSLPSGGHSHQGPVPLPPEARARKITLPQTGFWDRRRETRGERVACIGLQVPDSGSRFRHHYHYHYLPPPRPFSSSSSSISLFSIVAQDGRRRSVRKEDPVVVER